MGMTALALIPIFISGNLTSPALSGRLSAKQATPSPLRDPLMIGDLLNATVGRIFWPKSKFISSIEAPSSNYRWQDRSSA
jgi:hypothetical protein